MATFTISEFPVLEAECPAVPAEATKWERQEADYLWREALRCYRQLITRLVHDHEDLVSISESRQGFPSDGPAVDLLTRIHGAQNRLDAHLDGIKHRLAVS